MSESYNEDGTFDEMMSFQAEQWRPDSQYRLFNDLHTLHKQGCERLGIAQRVQQQVAAEQVSILSPFIEKRIDQSDDLDYQRLGYRISYYDMNAQNCVLQRVHVGDFYPALDSMTDDQSFTSGQFTHEDVAFIAAHFALLASLKAEGFLPDLSDSMTRIDASQAT